jgi:hypothetical protein
MKNGSAKEHIDGTPESAILTAANKKRVLSALKHLRDGNFEDAVGEFAERFCFNDRALGLEFVDKEQLREFFQRERELYPDSSFQTRKVIATEKYVITEWLVEYAIKEPFCGEVMRDVPISVQGVSIVRTEEDGITEWSDYYDGLVSRPPALTAHFTDWSMAAEFAE